MTRALFAVPFALTSLVCVAPAMAQDPGRRTLSLDSAAVMRALFVRPPSKPPVDAVDVIGFPFRMTLFPVRLAARTLAGMAGLATLRNPPAPVLGIRRMRAWGLTPRIRSIGPRSGAALAFELSRFRPFFAEAGISIVGSQRHRLGVAFGDSAGGPGALQLAVGFRRDAQENFWGIGGQSREVDRSDFRRDKWEAGARGWIRLGPFVGSADLGVEHNVVERGTDGSLPDLQDTYTRFERPPFGAEERTTFVRLRVSSAYDAIRGSGFHVRGVRLSVGTEIFRGIDTESDFHRVTGQVIGYLPVSPWQTLAVRGRIEANVLDGGSDIPFYDLARFGGRRNGPRGFEDGRFRDRVGVSLMTEWRYEIWEAIGGGSRVETFLLFDQAGVASGIGDFGPSDLRSSYGFGMRFVRNAGVSGLWYVAFSDEGAQIEVATQWHF